MIANYLSTQQGLRLDARCSFVQTHDAHVAGQLLQWKVFGIAVAAQYLQTLIDRYKAHLCAIGFGYGGEQFQQLVVMLFEFGFLSVHLFQIQVQVTL